MHVYMYKDIIIVSYGVFIHVCGSLFFRLVHENRFYNVGIYLCYTSRNAYAQQK